MNEAFTKL